MLRRRARRISRALRAFGAGCPITPFGDIDVYLSVDEADGTPVYALPLANDDGERRYRLGKAKFR